MARAARKQITRGLVAVEKAAQKTVTQSLDSIAKQAGTLPVVYAAALVRKTAEVAVTKARDAAASNAARSFEKQTGLESEELEPKRVDASARATAKGIGESFAKAAAKHLALGLTATAAYVAAAKDSRATVNRAVTTEVMSSWNAEAARQAQKANVTIVRTWNAELDACEVCSSFAGTTVRGNEQFPEGDPPLHPHCRCVIESSVEKGDAIEYAIDRINAVGVENAEYMREGMRDLTTHRGAFDGASKVEVNRIAAGESAAVNTGKTLPPITVVVDGEDVILRDGRHRMIAAREAGANRIRANVITYANGEKVERETVLNIRKK